MGDLKHFPHVRLSHRTHVNAFLSKVVLLLGHDVARDFLFGIAWLAPAATIIGS